MRPAPPARVGGRYARDVMGWGLFAVGVLTSGCASSNGAEASTGTDEGATTATTTDDAFVYFHGMSQLGFNEPAVAAAVGTTDFVAPGMTDAQILAGPSPAVLDFVAAHRRTTMAGYSLGRVPVLRSMSKNVAKVTRVVMIDPTYDSAKTFGKTGGAIARAWLDGADERTFMLVYGDVTTSVGGEASYVAELDGHPRAAICYVPGDHARFRRDDMAQALVASSCDDLATKLAH